jgi:hypothetical protein
VRLSFRIAASLVLAATPLVFAQQQPTGTPAAPSPEPGLLFYLSADHGFKADYAAGGTPDPNFLKDVKILPGGAKGSYLQCGNDQLLSYWAPGNIYSQRGTLAFDWRSRMPADETEFPIFRVGFGDHSSWDMVWLRIDYNGHGFDAFVTDVNLGRTRISYTMPNFPKPDEWVHLALAWDETNGIRFYVNGKLAATKPATGLFDSALDQFGPHSRIIAPTGVESSYNYDRGGDLDELRIYDRELSDDNIAQLANHEIPQSIPAIPVDADAKLRAADFDHRFGFDRPNDLPALLPAANTIVRKVEIQDVYDLKRWQGKGTDGIRETTWPGVYNRSPLTGRFDYFQLPDWDTYAISGKSVTFYMPDEPWNHLEIQGGAWGQFATLTPGNGDPKAVADPDQHDPTPQLVKPIFDRPKGLERSTHDLKQPITGERIRFTNVEQWQPIGEFAAYYVHPGDAPAGIFTLRYNVTTHADFTNPSVTPLTNYIAERYTPEERSTMIASPGAAAGDARSALGHNTKPSGPSSLGPGPSPIVHILIPASFRSLQADEGHGATYSWENLHAGLDGIAIDLPALNLKPTHGDVIPLNIQIKDPIWNMRDMFDFSFSVKPNEPHTLFLDTRDRILPNGKSLWIQIASANPDFNTTSLEGAHIRLIFKPFEEAVPEHVADRLTQVRDNYANIVEESVNSNRLNIYNRYEADITDLLRVDPTNELALHYWHEKNPEQPDTAYTPPPTPAGVPDWAWLQTRDLAELRSLINWYIDNRQTSDGELGGGLSDDTDFWNWWPGLALMGSTPDKVKASLNRGLEATFNNGMWENGLARAQYDELHSYEDGLNTLSQSMFLDYGSPKQLERAMQTSKRLEWLTGYNSAGQRQIRSSYYSGTKIAENGVWGWGKDRSYYVMFPALLLANYNGTPETEKMITEVADGFLAHRHTDADGRMHMHFNVNFHTNEDLPSNGLPAWFMLWGAYKFTNDQKYLVPFADNPPEALRTINADALDILNVRDTWGKQLLNTAAGNRRSDSGNASETTNVLDWQLTGDTSFLNKTYTAQLQTAFDRQFINREGSLWIDRIYFNNGELQRSRLGGVALMRNYNFPGNVVSWRFTPTPSDPQPDTSVGILVPVGTPDHIKITAFNMDKEPITAQLTGWEINPGKWDIIQGTMTSDNGPISNAGSKIIDFERSASTTLTLAPGYNSIELTLQTPGVPYWSRPDLGIDPEDVKITGRKMSVTIHSLGAIDAPPARLILRDATGKVLASTTTPTLKPPTDLIPKTATVSLTLPAKSDYKGGTLTIESSGPIPEITQLNNEVHF